MIYNLFIVKVTDNLIRLKDKVPKETLKSGITIYP